ncbi:hypothetical protein ACFLUS_06015 [Chloroflexota bacterium]
MNDDVMRKVFHLGDSKPTEVSFSGSTKWLLAELENVSLYVFENLPGAEFAIPGHPEEVVIIVLEGLLMYEDGRIVRGNESVVQLPNTSYKGRYGGVESIRLLAVKVVPIPNTTPPNPDLMKKTIRIRYLEPFRRPSSGSLQRIVAITENLSITYLENKPVAEFPGLGHPQTEIVYMMQGKIEYGGGRRVVRPGEAICNIAGLPHPSRYAGTEPIKALEILSPPQHNP